MASGGDQQWLDRWSRDHAALMSVGLGIALFCPGALWLVAVAAGASFARLILGSARDWTPTGHFGAANALTTGRLLLVLSMDVALPRASGALLGGLVMTTLALDGADGWLARRLRSSSRFGAHFDMEVDALLVLSTSILLWASRRCGVWILLAGALRYAYVLCCAWSPPRGGPMPRTLLGRSAFALVVSGHALGFLLSGTAGPLWASLGTAAVTLSFARSFWYGYAMSAKPAVES